MMRRQEKTVRDGEGDKTCGMGGDGNEVCGDGVVMEKVLWKRGVDEDEQLSSYSALVDKKVQHGSWLTAKCNML